MSNKRDYLNAPQMVKDFYLKQHTELTTEFVSSRLNWYKNLKKKVTHIKEKPKKYFSNNAITGLYFFDKSAVKYSKTLTQSIDQRK